MAHLHCEPDGGSYVIVTADGTVRARYKGRAECERHLPHGIADTDQDAGAEPDGDADDRP